MEYLTAAGVWTIVLLLAVDRLFPKKRKKRTVKVKPL